MEQEVTFEYDKRLHKTINLKIGDLSFSAREAINVLRGNIQLSGYDMKVVAVTSAVANEGKSAVAFRLAKSMAALKKRTIYVDCDIRNSVTKKRYHIFEKTVGLSEYLCGNIGIYDMIYRTDDPWMHIIFTGAAAPNPSELISGAMFSELIAQLRKHYDYVVVDTAPVNLVIDGALAAKQCDGTVLVVESGVTERAQAMRAKQQLEYAGARILGVVLNKIGTKKSGYGYQYGYGYGKKYGYGYGKKYGYGYGEQNDSSKRKKRKAKKR